MKAALKPCTYPGCGALTSGARCDRHQQAARREADAHRPNAGQRGYNSRWRRYREGFLSGNPLCAECARFDRIEAAVVVDHVVPHRGDQALFWAASNHQPLCLSCHGAKSQAERLLDARPSGAGVPSGAPARPGARPWPRG